MIFFSRVSTDPPFFFFSLLIPDSALKKSFSVSWQGFLDSHSKVLVDGFAKCALPAS